MQNLGDQIELNCNALDGHPMMLVWGDQIELNLHLLVPFSLSNLKLDCETPPVRAKLRLELVLRS